jgi:hypothetical protein
VPITMNAAEFSLSEWTHKQYDLLERAITSGTRISAYRRGTEFLVVPERLRIIRDREAIESTHPTTGERIVLYLDELDTIESVR